jgi:hypothetical protein
MHQLGELLDYDGASALLGISKRTVQRLVESGGTASGLRQPPSTPNQN